MLNCCLLIIKALLPAFSGLNHMIRRQSHAFLIPMGALFDLIAFEGGFDAARI
jgi:hypothetical protein